MGEWKEYKLGHLVEVKGGKRLPKGALLVDYDTGHPYIRVTDLGKKWVKKDGLQFVTPEIQKAISRYTVNAGDVILSIVGSIGFTGRISDELTSANLTENCVKFIAKTKTIDNDYLYYFLSSKTGQEEIDKRVVGSTQPKLPLYNIKDIEILLPSLLEQKSIASVLGSLDDKIDLLHHQNKILEGLAETLFRQWFIEEAEERWEIGTVKDLFILQRGFDLPAQHRRTGKYPIISASGVNGYHHEYKVQAPGVTTGRSGLLGKVYYIVNDFWPLNTSLFIVEYKLAKPLFSYYFLKTLDLVGLNGGSAVPTLNRNDVHSLEISLPPLELIDRFESLTQPMFHKIKENRIQIETLTRLRDTLLPKLMSGEVRVKG